MRRSTFRSRTVVGRYEHPAYGALTVRAQGDRLVMQFRALRFTLAYQGEPAISQPWNPLPTGPRRSRFGSRSSRWASP